MANPVVVSDIRNEGDARGLWEGRTPPITALPDKNQGGDFVVTRDDRQPKLLCRGSGSTDYSYTLTVDLGIDDEKYPEGEQQSPRNGNVIAILEWGHGAASFRAEVDFKRGTQVSVVATSMKVFAVIDADADPDDGTILSARVNAAMIWGTRPARGHATRTQRRVVAANSSVIVEIPAFAECLFVGSSDPEVMNGAKLVTFAFLGGPLATDRVTLVFNNGGAYLLDLLTIPGAKFPEGSRFLEVTNSEDVDVDVNLVWGLFL